MGAEKGVGVVQSSTTFTLNRSLKKRNKGAWRCFPVRQLLVHSSQSFAVLSLIFLFSPNSLLIRICFAD